jgi:hypothetical protein
VLYILTLARVNTTYQPQSTCVQSRGIHSRAPQACGAGADRCAAVKRLPTWATACKRKDGNADFSAAAREMGVLDVRLLASRWGKYERVLGMTSGFHIRLSTDKPLITQVNLTRVAVVLQSA